MSLDEIRQRTQAATDAPWTPQDYDHNPGDQGVPIIGGGEIGSMAGHLTAYTMTLSSEAQSVADAEFIAHARTDIPRLLAAVDAILALADYWETSAGPGTTAERVYGAPQKLSVEFAVDRIRAAVTDALGGEQ